MFACVFDWGTQMILSSSSFSDDGFLSFVISILLLFFVDVFLKSIICNIQNICVPFFLHFFSPKLLKKSKNKNKTLIYREQIKRITDLLSFGCQIEMHMGFDNTDYRFCFS